MANLKSALNWATQKLNKIDSKELDAEILLAFVLKKNKTWLFSNPEKKLTKPQELRFKKLIALRARHQPIAYLTGHKEFFGYNFTINKNVLVPRPLTEELVEQALKYIQNNKKRPLAIADIGTGSGCIIIAVAKKLAEKENLKKFTFYATDISAKALMVAKKNAKLYGLTKKIKFYQGDLLKPLLKKKIDLILTNPPYLTETHFKKEKSIQQEPKIALVGNLYNKLFTAIKTTSAKGPLRQSVSAASGLASGQKIPVNIIYEDLKGIHQKKINF